MEDLHLAGDGAVKRRWPDKTTMAGRDGDDAAGQPGTKENTITAMPMAGTATSLPAARLLMQSARNDPDLSMGESETSGQPRAHSMPMDDPDLEVLDGDNQNASSDKNVPRVGLCFQSEEEAYKFYNAYAQTKGFSIRRCHKKYRADGTLCSRYLVCSKEGVKATHPTHVTKKERATSRTSCSGRVQFSITREGTWNIQKVVLNHNHHLVTPDSMTSITNLSGIRMLSCFSVNFIFPAKCGASCCVNQFDVSLVLA